MILAADFGGTTIKLGIVEHGAIQARGRLEAHADRPMPDRLEAVADAWEQLLRETGRSPLECRGTAFALPFVADPSRCRVLGDFGKFPGAEAIDFAAWSETRLALPTALENDLRVALLGEATAGAASGKADAVMLALGTGIGCAVLSGHNLLRGANNRAGTLLGHSTVDYQGPRGRCGNVGCAEDLASTATLAERARRHPAFAQSELARAGKIDFETVFGSATRGDVCSVALVEQSLRVWAVVVQNAVLAYDPEVVVLGGGVLRSAGVVLPAVEQHLRAHTPGLPSQTPIVAAALGDDAALIGAETLFKRSHPALFL
jgi:glucokinase